MRMLILTALVVLVGCTEARLSDSEIRSKLAAQRAKADASLAETQPADAGSGGTDDDLGATDEDLAATDEDLGATDDDALAKDADATGSDAAVETSPHADAVDAGSAKQDADAGPDVPANPDVGPDVPDVDPDVPSKPDASADVPTCDASKCNDGNPCTVDGCTPTSCTHTLDATAAKCDDGNPCTADGCTPAGCSHLPDNAGKCSDSDPCTDNFCAGGLCESKPVDCDDLVNCTLDACDPVAAACAHKPANAACDDGKACTTDTCNKDAGCAHKAIVGACDDGDACTVNDACVGLACVGTSDCDDGNGCTTDSCSVATGCAHALVTSGTACGANAQCDSVGGCTLNAVGCGKDGTTCGSDKGTCSNGHCFWTDAKGYKWTLVPAGTFWMGCNAAVDAECQDNEKPQHLVDMSAYWIGVNEVTVSNYKACIDGGGAGCSTPGSGGFWDNWGVVNKEQDPVNEVTRAQSQAYCNWLGGDLPSEAQWEKAAKGGCEVYAGKDCATSEPKYPWGNSAPVCGQQAVFGTGTAGCGTSAFYPVGTGSLKGQSPYGLYDMAGGVRESVLDSYDAGFYAKAGAAAKDPVNSASAPFHVSRGGSIGEAVTGLRSSVRTQDETAKDYVGIRCARPAVTCISGTNQCSGTSLETCKPDGSGWETVNCDDGNTCTTDTCDKTAGGCQHSNTTAACDDGNACTSGDVCGAGVCKAGTPKVCSGTDVCVSGVCKGPPDGMVLIPAGSFKMGCVAGDGSCLANENPQHTAALDAYYMDVYEVTAAKYKACVDAGGCTAPSTTSALCSGNFAMYNNWDAATGKPKSGREQHPVNCVDWTQADAYCKWTDAKGHLPTEAQWEKAARGGLDDKKFPWGDSDPTCTPGLPNTAVWSSSGDGDGCGKGSTWAGGTGSAKNGYGLYDMAGNVWEWAADWYSDSYSSSLPATNPAGPASGTHRVLRGGGFGLNVAGGLRASRREKYAPLAADDGLGFRCSRSLP